MLALLYSVLKWETQETVVEAFSQPHHKHGH